MSRVNAFKLRQSPWVPGLSGSQQNNSVEGEDQKVSGKADQSDQASSPMDGGARRMTDNQRKRKGGSGEEREERPSRGLRSHDPSPTFDKQTHSPPLLSLLLSQSTVRLYLSALSSVMHSYVTWLQHFTDPRGLSNSIPSPFAPCASILNLKGVLLGIPLYKFSPNQTT